MNKAHRTSRYKQLCERRKIKELDTSRVESQLILEAEPPAINNIDFMIGAAEEEKPSNSTCTNCVNNELKIATLKSELDDCKKKLTDCEINYTKLKRKVEKSKVKYFNFSSLTDDNMVNFFTGMATFSIFSWLLNRIKPHVKLFHKSLSLEDHLLIVLMKLKLGLLNKDIAQRFGVSSSTITKIFRGWVPIMGSSMKNLIVWPDVEFFVEICHIVSKKNFEMLFV